MQRWGRGSCPGGGTGVTGVVKVKPRTGEGGTRPKCWEGGRGGCYLEEALLFLLFLLRDFHPKSFGVVPGGSWT